MQRAEQRAKRDERKWVACAIVAFLAAIPIAACTDGTTPDCSSPEAGCAPDLSGSVEGGDGGTIEGSTTDAPVIDSAQPINDSGDASLDADAHG